MELALTSASKLWNTGPVDSAITFLFTDIEGSTRLWQEHPEQMPDVLARHDSLLKEVISTHGGHLFKNTGDGICAAFPDAATAIAAAVEIQRSFSEEAWASTLRPKLRVALDTGPAHRRDADYFGSTLNRTARILSAGWGGQILASAETVGLVQGMKFIDLGFHRLRDLGQPIRLHQVEYERPSRAFPPLRSLERFLHFLPVLRSSFVGRETEIARLRKCLSSSRLVTITGVGGCGKTRLALAVASLELENFTDGVYFVDLSVVSDPSLVWNAIATVLGLGSGGPAGELPARERTLHRLKHSKTLLVLDNCEHLLDPCAEVVTAVLEGDATAAILATSRELLGVEGERVVRVSSLSLPKDDDDDSSEAVRLFVERATSADSTLALTTEMLAAVAEICRRLDGIPLAIELAAARVRHFSVAEIGRRLDDRFRLLTGGPRSARQRQQTLAAALDWSFQLLNSQERGLLRRAAVFADGFSLAAVEGVCADETMRGDQIADILGALVDKSLVSLHAAEGRYRLLETIRLYALERLVEAGETTSVRDRHLAWFDASCASEPAGKEAGPADNENIRVARAWAIETGDLRKVARLTVALFFRSTFYQTDLMEEDAMTRRALEWPGLDAASRADLLTVAGFIDIRSGEWESAKEHARAAIAIAGDDIDGVPGVACIPLTVALMVNDPDAAEVAIDDGLASRRRARKPIYPESFLKSFKVGTALMRGDIRTAADLGRSIKLGSREPVANLGLAYALHLLGHHEAAELDAAERPSETREGGFSEHSRSLLFTLTGAARGEWSVAAGHLAAAAEIVRRYRVPLTLNDCVVACGALATMELRYERACTLLAASVDRGSVRSPEMWAVYLHYRSSVKGALDADSIRGCRAAARGLDLEAALDEELSRYRSRAVPPT